MWGSAFTQPHFVMEITFCADPANGKAKRLDLCGGLL
jgi:hypothetical protein